MVGREKSCCCCCCCQVSPRPLPRLPACLSLTCVVVFLWCWSMAPPQGDGRRPPEEVVAMAKAELDAFATLLGEGPFFLGSERPTTLDCTMYAFISAVVSQSDRQLGGEEEDARPVPWGGGWPCLMPHGLLCVLVDGGVCGGGG